MKDLINTLGLTTEKNKCLHPVDDVIVSVVLRESFLKTLPNGKLMIAREPQSHYLNVCVFVDEEAIEYIDICEEKEFYEFMHNIKTETCKTICKLSRVNHL
jgi:hypothetical protein